MKRSEMLKAIRDQLLHKPYDEDWENQILTTVEKLGMQPPVIISLPHSYNRSEGTYGFEVNEWESENE